MDFLLPAADRPILRQTPASAQRPSFARARDPCEGRGMSLLAVKLVVTPLMVLVAWLAARRWARRSAAGLSACR